MPLPESQPPAEAAPALTELIAAGLVSHEVIGDPARLGGETAALEALCRLVAGPVYRIDAFHYGFRAGPDDLGGRLAALPPGDWTAALAAALAAALGAEAAWLNPTDLLPEAGAALAQPLLLLRAQGAAVGAGLEAAGPGLQAVVNARYAAEVARLTAAAAAPADRLAALAARQDEIAAALDRVAGTLALVLQRLDAQAERARGAAEADAFHETLGLTLAELLAQFERQDAERPRAPLLS